MVQRKTQPHSNASTILIFIIVAILLIASCYFAYSFWKSQQPNPQLASSSANPPALPADLISDDRMIFGGIPRPNPEVQVTILKNLAYMVGYSETRKDPLWSAFRVIHTDHPFILERPSGAFPTDNRTTARVAHHDFTGSGYDRGHMTPNSAIARFYGAEAQRETFLLSNICPQSPNLNREVWAKLEMDITDYTSQFDEIWVTCGPIFADMNGGITHTLRSGIAIPSSFYKIAVEDQSGKIRLFSAIMPQGVKGTELPQQFLTSVRQIEDQTGLEFLWKLDPQTCATLENQVYPLW